MTIAGGIRLSVIRIQGLHCLEGTIRIQGSKNAVLPLMAASLLHKGTIVLTNVPRIQDVYCMMGILESLGCVCEWEEHTLTIHAGDLCVSRIPQAEAGQMRSSVMLLGPLLGRLKEAVSWHPGGCSIGKRPIDLHLLALRRMGADIRTEGEQITASTQGLKGCEIIFPISSVGATENAVMAAVAAEGTTILRGASVEPEIVILCRFLEKMGARIGGIGTDTLVIEGGKSLHDVTFEVPGDRIVAGTYAGAVLAAGGDVMLQEAPAEHLEEVLRVIRKTGGAVQILPEGIRVRMEGRPGPVEITTGIYPGFPTDLQSVMVAVAAVADGDSRIHETVFEGRFASAKELQKLGGHIIIEDRTVCVTGTYPLRGGAVCAPDLRGGAALVVAGLAAQGTTILSGYEYIRRGYEDICRDLAGVGAKIELKEA